METCAIFFSDISGFSQLNDHQLKVYAEKIMPLIGEIADKYRSDFKDINTWGDAIMAVSSDPYKISDFALDIRDFFNNTNWEQYHLPNNLSIRIALHAGPVFIGPDPIRKTDKGFIGKQMNLASRIEPITSPGEIHVTDIFFNLAKMNDNKKITFDDLGEKELAKKAGVARLYRLRRITDPKPDISMTATATATATTTTPTDAPKSPSSPNPTNSDQIKKHDRAIIDQSQKIISSDEIESIIEDLTTNCHYYYEKWKILSRYVDFFNSVDHAFIDTQLKQRTSDLIRSFHALSSFTSTYFFSDRMRKDRFVLMPAWNVDRGEWNGSPEDTLKYHDLHEKLNTFGSKFIESYKSYRMAIKETHFI